MTPRRMLRLLSLSLRRVKTSLRLKLMPNPLGDVRYSLPQKTPAVVRWEGTPWR